MHHFFIKPSQINWENRTGHVTGPDVHHMVDVLRLQTGSKISVSDGMGNRYTARIKGVEADQVDISLLEKVSAADAIKTLPITLVQGVAKGSKMDWIVQKNTEMGIGVIQPITTQFTVVKFQSDQDAAKKQDRWQKIAIEAAKQSKRSTIPSVKKPVSLETYIDDARRVEGRWLRLLAYEKESGKPLKETISPEALERYDGIELWIGPEGGFSEKEIDLAKDAGIQTIGLGPRILRTETASIALLAVVLYEMGVLEA